MVCYVTSHGNWRHRFFRKSLLDAYVREILKPWGISTMTLLARHRELPDKLHNQVSPLCQENIDIYIQDIATADTMPDADYVIHSAVSSNALVYQKYSISEFYNMHKATENYCRLAKIYYKNSKTLFVSSRATYGFQHQLLQPIDEFLPLIINDHEFKPASDKDYYALNKCHGERLFIKYSIQYCLRVVIARCFAFIGPWLPHDQHFAIGNFLEDGFKKRSIRVNAKYPVVRSYVCWRSCALVYDYGQFCKPTVRNLQYWFSVGGFIQY